MDYRLLFPNDYIASHDLRGKDVSKTIKAVTLEKLRMTGGRVEKKPVVLFSDTPKKLVLNKTNAKLIAAQHGAETDRWVGKKIVLYPTTTLLGTATVECVRVREQAPPKPAHQPATPDEDPFDIDAGEEAAAEEPADGDGASEADDGV